MKEVKSSKKRCAFMEAANQIFPGKTRLNRQELLQCSEYATNNLNVKVGVAWITNDSDLRVEGERGLYDLPKLKESNPETETKNETPPTNQSGGVNTAHIQTPTSSFAMSQNRG
jgi:hypothetical protein